MKDDAKIRKPYEKPELRVIEMKEEEVLAVGCKSTGPLQTNVNQSSCGYNSNCNQLGS